MTQATAMLVALALVQAAVLPPASPPAAGPANPASGSVTSAPTAQSWSILAPVPEAQCRPTAKDNDIVVCATSLPSLRLPYPELVGPSRPRPVNPDSTGIVALGATDAAAAKTAGTSITGGGGGGIPLLSMARLAVTKAAKGIKKLTAPADKSKRVAIDLSDPAQPPPVGAVRPPAASALAGSAPSAAPAAPVPAPSIPSTPAAPAPAPASPK